MTQDQRLLRIFAVMFILLFLITALLFAPAGAADPRQRTLVFGAESEFEKINPVLNESHETPVDPMIFTGLTRFDENNQPVADLATEWSVSPDGKTYTFKLRKDVKWHDGKPFTAEDAKFTIDSILDPKTNSLVKSQFDEVNRVEVVDSYAVRIILKNPYPPILDSLTTGMVPKHLLSGKDLNTSEFNSHPVGTGPFKYNEWRKGEYFVMKANTDYYRGKPKLDTVIFKFVPDMNVRAVQLETAELDVALLEPQYLPRLEKSQKVKAYIVPTADYRVMMYNFRNPLWQDVRVRKALNYAVKRDQILQGLLMGHGKIAYGPLQYSWANEENVERFTYNPEKARTMLAEAGWKAGSDGILAKDGQRFSFRLTTFANDPLRVAIANALSTDFKEIGVEAIPDPKPRGTFKWPEVDAFVLGWGSPFDPDDHTYKLFHSSQIKDGWNLGAYQDPMVDQLLDQARTTSDLGERKKYYSLFQKRLADNPPYDFLVYLDAVWVVNKDVTGIRTRALGHHGAGFLWNIEEWSKQ